MFALLPLPVVSRRLPGRSPAAGGKAETHALRRESVSVSADLFSYCLEVLEPGSESGLERKAVLRTQIITVCGRYRLILEGKVEPDRHRLFYDNAESPLASRDAAGRRYRREMATAMRWLAEQTGVKNIESLPLAK